MIFFQNNSYPQKLMNYPNIEGIKNRSYILHYEIWLKLYIQFVNDLIYYIYLLYHFILYY